MSCVLCAVCVLCCAVMCAVCVVCCVHLCALLCAVCVLCAMCCVYVCMCVCVFVCVLCAMCCVYSLGPNWPVLSRLGATRLCHEHNTLALPGKVYHTTVKYKHMRTGELQKVLFEHKPSEQ